MKRFATLMVGLALMLAPSAALAQTSECQTYGPETCAVTTGQSTTGSLPFTGLDTPLLVVVGSGLLGAGLVVRRLSRASN